MNPKFRLWIWLIMIFGGLLISVLLDLLYFRSLFLSWKFHLLTFPAGAGLLYAVRRVSRNTGRILAKHGRDGNIPRFETNRLVDKGPYAYMRHPMHLGLLFFPLSFGLLAGSPAFILFVWPLEMIFMLLMIKYVEEPEAMKKFGKAYKEFTLTRPWFCVRPECLKSLWREVDFEGGKSPLSHGCR